MSSAPAETLRPLLRGRRGAVAAGHPLSAEAGLRLLQQGGNAVDAGCAALLAASVVEFSHFSFGGEVPIAIAPAGGRPRVICGQGGAPQLATREFFAERGRRGTAAESAYCASPGYATIAAEGGQPGAIPSSGLLAATVPGVLGAVVTALEQFGTQSLAAVLQPAIELADGFPLDETRAQALASRRAILERWPSSARVFLPGGRVPAAGELFAQPDLARTLRELAGTESRTATHGRSAALQAARDHFYAGALAQRIGAFCEQHGGLLRAADLAGFRAALEEPTRTVYRGYEIYKTGFWAQGPVLLQVLNLLEGLELRALGHGSSAYVHVLVEALKLGFADRDRYYGDPAFAKVPAEALLSKDYAAARRALIDPRRASLLARPGDPWNGRPLLEGAAQPPAAAGGAPGASRDTTCVNAVDAAGNLFSATPSGAWLPAVVAGDTGVLLGQRLQSFVLEPGHPNALEPGKRPRITLSPTLVLRDGAPLAALSTPGGDNQDQTLLQVLLNIVEFDMNLQQALEAPRFQTLHLVSSFDDHRFQPGVLNLESRFDDAARRELAELGHAVALHGPFGNPAAPTAVAFRAETAVCEAAADPRRGRYALAW